jgi:hypothetical protein
VEKEFVEHQQEFIRAGVDIEQSRIGVYGQWDGFSFVDRGRTFLTFANLKSAPIRPEICSSSGFVLGPAPSMFDAAEIRIFHAHADL